MWCTSKITELLLFPLLLCLSLSASAASGSAESNTAAEPLAKGNTRISDSCGSSEATTGVLSMDSGWAFDQVILAIQPFLQYSGKKSRGIAGFFDSTETSCPVPLNADTNWNFEDTPARLAVHCFGREEFFMHFLRRIGACYYHTILLKRPASKGGDILVHQFWYYFPMNSAAYFGADEQGFAMVEIDQMVSNDPDLEKRLKAEVVADLRAQERYLEDSIKNSGRETAKELGGYLDKIRQILSKPIDVPLNYYISKVYTTSLMRCGRRKAPVVHVYDRKDLKWHGSRPVIYVSEGSHNLVGSLSDLKGEQCTAPYLVHPEMRELLINLHNPYDRLNPFPAGVNVHNLKLGGQFAEHPLYWLGGESYLEKLKQGEDFSSFSVRWKHVSGKEDERKRK